MTNREVISQVRESNEFMSFDHLVTDRYLLSLINKYGLTLFRRDFNKRKYSNTSNIPASINCFALEPVPIAECIGYVSDVNVAKSVYKLPAVEQSYYSYMMQVYDIEQSNEFLATTPKQYINILNRRFKPKDIFYWIQDGYLYVSNPDIKKVRINAIFTDYVVNTGEIDECGETNCDSCPDCFEPLDQTFKFPGHLVYEIIAMVNQELANTHQRYKEDNTDDLMTP